MLTRRQFRRRNKKAVSLFISGIWNVTQFTVQNILILIIGQYWRLSSIEQERIQWQQLALKKPGPKVERPTNCKIQNCGISLSGTYPKIKEQYMTNIQAYNSHTICLNTKGNNTKENVYQTGWKEKRIDKINCLFKKIFSLLFMCVKNIQYS